MTNINVVRTQKLSAFLARSLSPYGIDAEMPDTTPLTENTWPQERTGIIEGCIDRMQVSLTGDRGLRGLGEPWSERRFPLRDQAYLLQFFAVARLPFEITGRLWLYDLRNFTASCLQWLQGSQPRWRERPPLLPPMSWFREKILGPRRRMEDKHLTEARLLIDALRQVVAEQRLEDSHIKRGYKQGPVSSVEGNP